MRCLPQSTHQGSTDLPWGSHSVLLLQLQQTAEDVAKMQEELESARPLLAQAAKDTLATMEELQVVLLDSPAIATPDCSGLHSTWEGLAGIASSPA